MRFFIRLIVLLCCTGSLSAQQTLQTPQVNSILYTGAGNNQPLIVGLGGSEGGNAWSSDHWKATRDSFIARGYAFLALGYFGAPGTPDTLNRIAIDAVHDAILKAASSPRINKQKIAIIGGSRGGDLALLLAAYYPDISCVVAIVPSHVTFPGRTDHFSTPAWTFKGRDLPFVPVNEPSVPFLMKRDLRGAFEAMLQDTAAERAALIPVQHIKGPVLLMSAKSDEICPSTPMCEKMMRQLKQQSAKHIAYDGGHGEPLKHFDAVNEYLDQHFKIK